MFKIKNLDRYLVYRFLELFIATLFICTFILLMQFLWKHITDIVGKGLDFITLAQFFFYSTLTIVPLALPLAILLASLMTFGNLGEKMELIAMKAAGISLFRIIASLIVLVTVISVSAFFFSNNVLPLAQQKLWTLIYSLRETSPELEIPTGEFYTGINGYNIYVREKGPDQKLLKNLMIYDFSNGFNNASVTVADSARLKMSSDKMYLVLTLYNGESFENLKKIQVGTSQKNIPYRRETFGKKEAIIDFNANISKLGETTMKDNYMSKNLEKLDHSIDSLTKRVDSIYQSQSQSFMRSHFFDRQFYNGRTFVLTKKIQHLKDTEIPVFDELKKEQKEQAIKNALEQAQFVQADSENSAEFEKAEKLVCIRHGIEWHRKFTLSVACLIFFFIGAPLGAIIRKGGLGLPIVISVLMFIVYYLFDNTGYKLAREDVWAVWEGIWLSTACLLPIGAFFTYKAATDSPVLNSEFYLNLVNKIQSIFSKKQQDI